MTSDAVRQPTLLGQAGDDRQEDQLTGRAARGEDAHHQAAPLDEPAVGDVAANTIAIEPVPRPISTPQVSSSCHDSVMKTVRPLPSAIEHERDRR